MKIKHLLIGVNYEGEIPDGFKVLKVDSSIDLKNGGFHVLICEEAQSVQANH